jgi:TetR/AcrR family tetracycline transcriptional repressor
MKVNREIVVEAGLKLLNEVGLEQLTLRRLAKALKIKPPPSTGISKAKRR